MKLLKLSVLSLTFLALTGCAQRDNIPDEMKETYPKSISLAVNNPGNMPRIDVPVLVSIAQLRSGHPDFNGKAFFVWAGRREVASQASDTDGDGAADAIIFNLDLKGMESQDIIIRYNPQGELDRSYRQRTQAELSRKTGGKFTDRKYISGKFQNVSYLKLPPEHTDHSEFIRYEGPGWESDFVGYRFYLDWRNAIDIFGKRILGPVLQDVGLDGYDSYHEMSTWGMDVLKVGESLGIGSIAMWEDGQANRVAVTDSIDCTILASGPVYSQIRTRYFGWQVGSKKYDLTSDLSISAGSRLTKNRLQITGDAFNLCTGLAKHPETEYFQSATDQGDWAYIALYGKQSLAGDNLGTAVLFNTRQLTEINEDQLNHVVVLKPYHQEVTYYFLAAWEKEAGDIKTEQAFRDHLFETVEALNTSLSIEY